jgi:RHS repeat-associated protein
MTYPTGDTERFTYTAQDQAFTNPANNDTVTFTFYDLTRIDYPDGTNEQYTYDGKGNVLTRVDQRGKSWTYTYDSLGQILTATNPSNGKITYTYNSDATLASEKDSDTGTTSYSYDTYKRISSVTFPDGSTTQIAYNQNDQMTSITDGNNHTYTYTYDANGNLIKETDPNSKDTSYAYDLMDRLTQATDRLGKVSTYTYDTMGRRASVNEQNNIQIAFGYDSRGWRNKTTLGGKDWQIGYDDEGFVSSKTTPAGRTTKFQTDELGNTTSITNPLNQTTSFSRDAMARITAVTDPLGRSTNYSYDNQGNLSGVTLSGVGGTVYQFNDSGLLSQITDLIGKTWTSAYTGVGRITSQSDPLGNSWRFSYDQRGQLSQTTYPDGASSTRSHDAVGNITRLLYSDGTDLQYTYDALDRLASANSLTLSRDANGRITATADNGASFGATYDDSGRVSSVAYNDVFTVAYTYDGTTGVLTGVSDNLTSTQFTFSYDDDLKLTSLSRSNGVNATFSYDDAGRQTRILDGSLIDIQYTLDAAGQVTRADMTVPLDPASLLTTAQDAFAYDSGSRVNGAGYAYDALGNMTARAGNTYSWDGASRLTGIGGVSLTYNGLEGVVTRSEGGSTIHYYYNLALDRRPIVAEQNESSGQFLRYYVWTPSGQLLYMIDAASGNTVYFYHFDRTGSTVALTDANGSVTDSYTYTPYGKLLQHNGTSPQPFTFVGRWGIRQEGTAGDFYQMQARYYDASTGRFCSKEPLWPVLGDPRLINPYQYALNNPLGNADPTGTFPQSYDVVYVPPPKPDKGPDWAFGAGKPPKPPDPQRKKMLALAKKLGIKGAQEMGKKALKKLALKMLEQRVKKKLAKKLAGKALKAAMKALAKKVNAAGLIIDGGLAIHELYTWATADNAAELMQDTLSYQLVEAAESVPVFRWFIQGVGSIVSAACGD